MTALHTFHSIFSSRCYTAFGESIRCCSVYLMAEFFYYLPLLLIYNETILVGFVMRSDSLWSLGELFLKWFWSFLLQNLQNDNVLMSSFSKKESIVLPGGFWYLFFYSHSLYFLIVSVNFPVVFFFPFLGRRNIFTNTQYA